MKNEIKYIKKTIIQSLEQNDEKGIAHGEYICHDVPDVVSGFDECFTICGEDENHVYTVLILKVNP